ncbi:hypothetical protein [Helicobacter cetorum]|uniref:hypothetical protein n=1 Tax=Helicobacter cetorum TaxID=138563 RepID=UPI000CF1176D|nr:hypothetical protein [Helicobacter cetorum]
MKLKNIALGVSVCCAFLVAKPILVDQQPSLENLRYFEEDYKDAPKWVFSEYALKPGEELGIAAIPIMNEKMGITQATSEAKMRLILSIHELFKGYRKEFKKETKLSDEDIDALRAVAYSYLLDNTKVTGTYINKKLQTAIVKIAVTRCELSELDKVIKKNFPKLGSKVFNYGNRKFKEQLGSICH